MPHRIEQLESTLRRTIGLLLTEGLSDPRVRGLMTVTEVKVTEDRHTAVVKVSVLPEDQGKMTIKALRHAAKHIRHQVSERTAVRTVPHLEFVLDESLKKQAKVIDAISQAMSVTSPQPSPDADDDGDSTS